MIETQEKHFSQEIKHLPPENTVKSINLSDVYGWALDQSQDVRIQALTFLFNVSGLVSNREAAKKNNRSEAAESQYGTKHKLGNHKYSKIEL